jgi:hypothetical protein
MGGGGRRDKHWRGRAEIYVNRSFLFLFPQREQDASMQGYPAPAGPLWINGQCVSGRSATLGSLGTAPQLAALVTAVCGFCVFFCVFLCVFVCFCVFLCVFVCLCVCFFCAFVFCDFCFELYVEM